MRPVAYFARVERLKNFDEAARIFKSLAETEDVMFVVVGRGADDKALIRSLESDGLIEKTLLRDRIDFDQVPSLVNLVRDHRGIFLSPSRAESFGLSAAEFISSGVPALLSDIPPHRELVEDDERFLYPHGDIAAGRRKAVNLLTDWEAMSQLALKYGDKFREGAFLKAWDAFLAGQNMKQGQNA